MHAVTFHPTKWVNESVTTRLVWGRQQTVWFWNEAVRKTPFRWYPVLTAIGRSFHVRLTCRELAG